MKKILYSILTGVISIIIIHSVTDLEYDVLNILFCMIACLAYIGFNSFSNLKKAHDRTFMGHRQKNQNRFTYTPEKETLDADELDDSFGN